MIDSFAKIILLTGQEIDLTAGWNKSSMIFLPNLILFIFQKVCCPSINYHKSRKG